MESSTLREYTTAAYETIMRRGGNPTTSRLVQLYLRADKDRLTQLTLDSRPVTSRNVRVFREFADQEHRDVCVALSASGQPSRYEWSILLNSTPVVDGPPTSTIDEMRERIIGRLAHSNDYERAALAVNLCFEYVPKA